MCEMLGGAMVSWSQQEKFKQIHTPSTLNLGSDKCPSFWTAIEYDGGVWKASYSREEQKNLTWGAGQPNGFEKENGEYTEPCIFVVSYGEGFYDTLCDEDACSICEIPERVEFTLRGLNPKQLKMDKKYTLYPQLQDNSKNFLILEGNQYNKMEIQFHSDKWNVSIIRESDNALLINTSNSPFEKEWWMDAFSKELRQLIVTKVRI